MDLQEALKALAALQKRQEELEAKLEAKDQVIQANQLEIKELTKDQEGWLITTANPLYDGKTYGVKFNSGMAFLPGSATYPHLAGKAKNKTYTPDAKRLAQMLQDEFGYEIEYFSYEQMKALKGKLDERTRARQAAEETKAAEQARVLSKGMQPARMG